MFFRNIRTTVVMLMTAVLSHIPNIALADIIVAQQQSLLPTAAALEELSRTESKARIDHYLQNDELKQKLALQGYSQSDIQARLNSLSDRELSALVQQMDQAQYGGDILITVLLVVLIIFLVKRI